MGRAACRWRRTRRGPAGRAARSAARRVAAAIVRRTSRPAGGPRGGPARLAFEELFLHQALLATRKRTHRRSRPAPRFGRPGETVGRWIGALPFEPTADQLAAFDALETDLDAGEPMQRLLMGEVGSGKTVVAVYAMLRALEAGHQAALMAPTETLAEQHAITRRLLAAEATPFALLTGAPRAPGRREATAASGELGLIVGTHALIERACASPASALRRRRAAPLRGPPAARAGLQGGRGIPARPAHDGDADPAHADPDRLRRPRRDPMDELRPGASR